MRENLLATTVGGVIGVLANMGQEIFTTLFLGMVGAFGGLIAKALWNWIMREYGKNKI
jgi:hypothetical protein